VNLLAKENDELTGEERNSLFKAVGTSSLPYPASHFVTDDEGRLQMEIGVIADDLNPLGLFSDQSHDHVVGLLYRDMAIPSLLHVQKEAILRRAPESRSRLMAILGDPGSGVPIHLPLVTLQAGWRGGVGLCGPGPIGR